MLINVFKHGGDVGYNTLAQAIGQNLYTLLQIILVIQKLCYGVFRRRNIKYFSSSLKQKWHVFRDVGLMGNVLNFAPFRSETGSHCPSSCVLSSRSLSMYKSSYNFVSFESHHLI